MYSVLVTTREAGQGDGPAYQPRAAAGAVHSTGYILEISSEMAVFLKKGACFGLHNAKVNLQKAPLFNVLAVYELQFEIM